MTNRWNSHNVAVRNYLEKLNYRNSYFSNDCTWSYKKILWSYAHKLCFTKRFFFKEKSIQAARLDFVYIHIKHHD